MKNLGYDLIWTKLCVFSS